MTEPQSRLFHDEITSSENGPGVRLSVSALALEFRCSRDSVVRHLSAAGVEPIAKVAGFGVFRLRDALSALVPLVVVDQLDPSRLAPHAAHSFWKAKNENLRFQTAARQLIHVEEVSAGYSAICKTFVQFLETFPDVLERDCGITGAAILQIQHRIDELRKAIYAKLISGPLDGI